MPDCNRLETGFVSWSAGAPVYRSGRGRWYDASDRLPGLDDVGDHQGQATAPLDEGKDWLLEIAFFPRDSLVGIVEMILVPTGFQYDHAALY